ncbi:hypothetical protein DES29_12820, partial [Sutterella wadsworthensis]
LLVHFHGISSAKHPILDLNHTSSGSVIREFRVKLAAVLSFWAGSDALLFLILLSLVGGLMVLGLPLLRMIETKTGFWAERLAEAFGRPLECTPIGLLGGEAQKGLPYGLAIAAGFAAVQFGVFSHIF